MPPLFKKTRGLFAEFKSFAVKGNAFELAIAVVVGNAFSAIVNSLVGDLITPSIGYVTGGGGDIKNLSITLTPISPLAATTTPTVVHYGSFISVVINFFIVTLSIFVVFKLFSAARRRLFRDGEEVIPPHEKPADVRLLEEIRDILKDKQQ